MKTPVEDHLLLTVRQASKLIQLAPNSVYALINRPKNPLPSIRVGRAIRVPAAALNQWVEEQTRG